MGTCKAVGLLCIAALLGLSAPALAQSTPPGPLPTPRIGDLGSDRDAFSAYRLSSPVRLSLEGSVSPVAGRFPQCATLEDDVGNSVGGIPVQYYRRVRLVPNLVLSMFSQLGCPIDAGIGAALTYAIPIRDSIAFVLGAGFYAAPGQMPLFGGLGPAFSLGMRGEPAPVSAAIRADVLWQASGGRPLGVGVESRGTGVQSVRFSGGF